MAESDTTEKTDKGPREGNIAHDKRPSKLGSKYYLHALTAGIYIAVTVWLAAVYILSCVYDQDGKSRNIEILVADLDGGVIGMSTGTMHLVSALSV